METKTVYSNIKIGIRAWSATHLNLLSMPYIKFSLLGFTNWRDMNNIKVNEWRFLGYKI